MDCTSNCKLKKHADCLVSAVSKEDLQYLKSYIKEKCSNAFSNSDSRGRNLLHVAASYGRLDILQWVFEELNLSTNLLKVKDKESGWTALHKAIYYGNVSCAVYLSKLLHEWKSLDHESHTFLDLAFLDSPEFNKKRKAKRLFHVIAKFESTEAGELDLEIGDHIEVIREYRNGWGDGKNLMSNIKGLFPLSFVEEIQEEQETNELPTFDFISELYMWGINTNYSLGIADGSNRIHPEHLEYFKSKKLVIQDVVLTKFHSIFLTDNGNVYTCGFGLGGRLGHGNEDVMFNPKPIAALKHAVIGISAGNLHTIVVDELGKVYTFGINDMHQLGHYPPPKKLLTPHIVSSKSLKSKFFIGVAAARFHSVIHTEGEVYTFGLNAGQLGHSKGEEFQTSPKLVSHLLKQETKIKCVKASDGATLVLMENGDLFLLQDYVCRKIALKINDVLKICIVGGQLTSKLIEFNKPEPLKIAILYKSGMINLWRPGYRSFRKIYWHNQNALSFNFTDISLGRDLVLISNTGICYIGRLTNKVFSKESSGDPKALFVSSNKVEVIDKTYSVSELVERAKENRANCEEVYLEKVPFIYHAQKCFTDPKNRVFAVLQKDPQMDMCLFPKVSQSTMEEDFKKLLDSARKDDNICDFAVKVDKTMIPCHKFILQSRLVDMSDYGVESNQNCGNILNFIEHNIDDVKKWIDSIYDINVKTVSKFPSANSTITIRKNETCLHLEDSNDADDIDFANKMSSLLIDGNFDDPTNDFAENVFDFGESRRGKKSAYRVQKERKQKSKDEPSSKKSQKSAQKKLVNMENLSRWRLMQHVSDVLIESADGDVFHCHKCILVSRLDYFWNMLDSVWIESTFYKSEPLKVCFPSKILNVLLHYLYTDDIPAVKNCDDISFIGEVIVCADQLLATRLKEMCELELVKKVSMKNVVEILEFGYHYNSQQVLTFTSEFISKNLPYFLESRSLEGTDTDILNIIEDFYKTNTIGMMERQLKPSTFHEQSDKQDKEFAQKLRTELSEWRKRSRTLSSMSDSSVSELNTSFTELQEDVFEKEQSSKSPEIIYEKAEKPSMAWQQSKKSLTKEKENVQNGPPILATNSVQTTKISPNKTTFKKMSQKERKKLLNASAQQDSPTVVSREEKEKKQKTWNIKGTGASPAPSFRDLLLEEESIPGNERVKKIAPTRSFQKRSNTVQENGNPWGRKLEQAPQKENPVASGNSSKDFSNIMRSQQEEKQERIKQQQKSLTLIQLEERAIEEITEYYKTQLNLEKGVEIVVRRKKATLETPLWSRDVT